MLKRNIRFTSFLSTLIVSCSLGLLTSILILNSGLSKIEGTSYTYYSYFPKWVTLGFGIGEYKEPRAVLEDSSTNAVYLADHYKNGIQKFIIDNIIGRPTDSHADSIKAVRVDEPNIPKTIMKTIKLKDDTTGHNHGWDPTGVKKLFTITGITDVNSGSLIVAHVHLLGMTCVQVQALNGGFDIACSNYVPNGYDLVFTVINAPVLPCC